MLGYVRSAEIQELGKHCLFLMTLATLHKQIGTLIGLMEMMVMLEPSPPRSKLSWVELVLKWGTNEPKLSQTTTLHIITPQPANVEEIILAPQLIGEVNLIIKGNPRPSGDFQYGNCHR